MADLFGLLGFVFSIIVSFALGFYIIENNNRMASLDSKLKGDAMLNKYNITNIEDVSTYNDYLLDSKIKENIKI
jgi:hypothetical protein